MNNTMNLVYDLINQLLEEMDLTESEYQDRWDMLIDDHNEIRNDLWACGLAIELLRKYQEE